MLKRIRRLPSPALVISAIALVIAVGGGGYALASLNSGKVKRIARKQADKEIRKKASDLSVAHAVTANTANTANTATNATTVGGETVKKFFMKGPANTATAVILHLDGLSISAGCNGTTQPIVLANGDTTDTQLKVHGVSGGSPFSSSWSSNGTTANRDLTGGMVVGSGNGTYSTAEGQVVSFSYSFDVGPTYGNFDGCTVAGQAIGG